jgi:hypothetical protein
MSLDLLAFVGRNDQQYLRQGDSDEYFHKGRPGMHIYQRFLFSQALPVAGSSKAYKARGWGMASKARVATQTVAASARSLADSTARRAWA